jgi:asparaginyl-tRNA synthetase
MDSRDLWKDSKKYIGKKVTLQGWIRNHRKQKEFGFIEFSDGMSFKHIQIVYENRLKDFEEIQKLRNGSSIEVEGTVVESQ